MFGKQRLFQKYSKIWFCLYHNQTPPTATASLLKKTLIGPVISPWQSHGEMFSRGVCLFSDLKSQTQCSCPARLTQKNILAEVEEQPFKDQNRTSAAEDGERLPGQQAEDTAGDRRAQETLQHTLHTRDRSSES